MGGISLTQKDLENPTLYTLVSLLDEMDIDPAEFQAEVDGNCFGAAEVEEESEANTSDSENEECGYIGGITSSRIKQQQTTAGGWETLCNECLGI